MNKILKILLIVVLIILFPVYTKNSSYNNIEDQIGNYISEGTYVSSYHHKYHEDRVIKILKPMCENRKLSNIYNTVKIKTNKGTITPLISKLWYKNKKRKTIKSWIIMKNLEEKYNLQIFAKIYEIGDNYYIQEKMDSFAKPREIKQINHAIEFIPEDVYISDLHRRNVMTKNNIPKIIDCNILDFKSEVLRLLINNHSIH